MQSKKSDYLVIVLHEIIVQTRLKVYHEIIQGTPKRKYNA